MSSSVNKIAAERNQRALMDLVVKPGNDVCADCKARNPRWASHNLGIFVCVNCASIHRKIGTHITKIKSLSLDTWTKEQVEHMRQNGNVKSNAFYNPNEIRHPPPTNMIDSERDSELEKFIRDKYEFKRFVDRSGHGSAPPELPKSVPIKSSRVMLDPAPVPTLTGPPSNFNAPLASANPLPTSTSISSQFQAQRSMSQPLPSQTNTFSQTPAFTAGANQAWNDLASLRTPAENASQPLQFAPLNSMPAIPLSITTTASSTNPYGTLPVNSAFPPVFSQTPQTSSTISLAPMTGVNIGSGNPFRQQLSSFDASAPPLFTPSTNITNPFNHLYASSSSPAYGTPDVVPSGTSNSGLQPLQPFAHTHIPSPMSLPSNPNNPFFQSQNLLQQTPQANASQMPAAPWGLQPDQSQQQAHGTGTPFGSQPGQQYAWGSL